MESSENFPIPLLIGCLIFSIKIFLDSNPISDYNESEIGFMEVSLLDVKEGNELKEFNMLYKEVDELYHRIALEIGLSDSAFFILYSIAEFGDGCLQKDIADQYFISRKTINSSIKNLEAQGLIELRKGSRRDMHLYLTESGQAFVKEKILPVFELENSVFQEFSKEECQQLLQLTKKYVMLCRKKIKETYHLSSEDL